LPHRIHDAANPPDSIATMAASTGMSRLLNFITDNHGWSHRIYRVIEHILGARALAGKPRMQAVALRARRSSVE